MSPNTDPSVHSRNRIIIIRNIMALNLISQFVWSDTTDSFVYVFIYFCDIWSFLVYHGQANCNFYDCLLAKFWSNKLWPAKTTNTEILAGISQSWSLSQFVGNCSKQNRLSRVMITKDTPISRRYNEHYWHVYRQTTRHRAVVIQLRFRLYVV